MQFRFCSCWTLAIGLVVATTIPITEGTRFGRPRIGGRTSATHVSVGSSRRADIDNRWIIAPRRQFDVTATDARNGSPAQNEPKTPLELNDRGEAFRNKGELDNAIKDFTEAIRLDPFFEWPYNNRGLAWAAKGEYDKALKDYAEAMRLNPKYAFPHNNRGLVWAAKGNFDDAIKDYSEAIRLDPNYAIPHNNRGLIWEEKKEWDNALNDYSEAIRINPNYTYPYNNRGRMWEMKGDFAKAIRDCAEAIQLDSNYPAPCNAIAWLRATCPDPQFRAGKEAIAYATKACELTGWKSYHELDTLAAAYAEAGEFTNAVIWEMTAIEKAPDKDKSVATERLELYRSNRPFHRLQQR